LICVICGYSLSASAAELTYWSDVRPILRKHCTVCHSERRLDEPEVSAGLALDKPENILKGSKVGKSPVVVAGKPEQSLIVTLLTEKNKKRAMPLDADPLPDADIATIRNWVATGAKEGTRPAEDKTAGVVAAARTMRKLDVSFATKATLPKTANLPGPLSITLPIGPLSPVAAVAFSPDGKLLASGVYGRVTIWDLATAKPVKVLTNVLAAVNDLKFSPDGSLLAVAGGQPSARGDLRLFETTDWKLHDSLGGHLDTVSCVSFSPDGTKLASASFDKTVRLWDVTTGKDLHTFTGHSDFIYSVAFAPSGEWYATVSKDRTGRIVNAATGKGVFTFSGMNDEVLAVAVGPKSEQVVTSGLEPALQWWDARTAERQKRIGGPGVASHEIAIDAKGTVCAVAGGDGSLRFYKPGGELIKAARADSAVIAVALDAAGKRAATGGAGGTVKLWDVGEARLLVTLWSGAGDGWLSLAPEGFVAGAEATLANAAWKAGGKAVNAKLIAPLKDAGPLGKAARGEKIGEPVWK
jgi:hypothetical protein